MKNPRFHFRRSVGLLGLAALFAILGTYSYGRASSRSGQQRQFDPFRYLPRGAKIKDRDKDVIFADLATDGAQEAIIFYTVGESNNDYKANILVLHSKGTGYEPFWENSLEGSSGFAPPTGVYDLNKTGRPQIVAYRQIGASCPGIFDIYEWFSGALERITGPWADNGQCQSVAIKDLDGTGTPEIIVRIRNYGVNQDIYRWNGKRYVLSNGRFPNYYNSELEELLKGANSPRIMPASSKLQLANQIVGVYIIQRRFDAAVAFCRELLEKLQNPALTQADMPLDRAKANMYRLMGDIHKAAGNKRMANNYYTKAGALPGPKS
jgi:hypothetical protein